MHATCSTVVAIVSDRAKLKAQMTDISEASFKSPKMLIADDDPAILRFLAERCVSMGFEVETATNGIQALIKARRSPPDILIIDVNMPEADGLSVCMRLLDRGRKPFEVVVVTASADPKTVEWCESLGAFYGRKGPDFWNSIASALAKIFPDMADRIKAQAMQPIDAQMRKRPRVLVVDDDPGIEVFLSSRLAKHGVDTLYASGGVQGFRVACKEEPSVIICDYSMPNGDAHYLLWRLRSTPTTENIPVFVMSGRRLDEVVEQNLMREVCGRPGAARIFMKTFDTDELFGALQKFCAFEKNH
jgi:CheY-like chemotaxis protein